MDNPTENNDVPFSSSIASGVCNETQDDQPSSAALAEGGAGSCLTLSSQQTKPQDTQVKVTVSDNCTFAEGAPVEQQQHPGPQQPDENEAAPVEQSQQHPGPGPGPQQPDENVCTQSQHPVATMETSTLTPTPITPQNPKRGTSSNPGPGQEL